MVKLKGATLIDSLIAVTISAIIIAGISFAFGFLLKSERPIAFYKAKEEINLLHENLVHSKAYFSDTFEHETYTIEQKVEPYQGSTKIWLVSYTIKINNKNIHTQNHLVLNEE